MDFFFYSPVVRTVSVTAGVVMVFDMPTVRTLADICSKNTGFAVHDGISSFDLLRCLIMGGSKISIG